MATQENTELDANGQPLDDGVAAYRKKWKEFEQALAEQQAEADRLEELKSQLPNLETNVANHRKVAFDAVKNFKPEGSLQEQVKGAAPDGSSSPFDLLVKQSGVKDAYFTENIKGKSADDYRKNAVGSLITGQGRPDYTTSENFFGESKHASTDSFIAGNMGLRHDKDKETAEKTSPAELSSAQSKQQVEEQLFNYRKEDQMALVNLKVPNGQSNATARKDFKSMAVAGPELQDKLLEKPATEILAHHERALNGEKISPENKLSASNKFFNISRFQSNKSNEVMKAIEPYAGALADKNAVIGDIAKSEAALSQKANKSKAMQGDMAAGFNLSSKSREKGTPQFDSENFEHFAKLNPSNPKDMAKLRVAAQMQMTATPDQLPAALQALASSARPNAAANNQAKTQADDLANASAAIPANTAATNSAKTPATNSESLLIQKQTQGLEDSQVKATLKAQQDVMTQALQKTGIREEEKSSKERTTAEPLSRGSSMPRPSSPEERARRVAQAEFFASRGLTSKSNMDDVGKAHEEFQKSHQKTAEEARAAQERRAAEEARAAQERKAAEALRAAQERKASEQNAMRKPTQDTGRTR